MALVNFTLPFSGIGGTPSWATVSPLQTHHATAVNNLLYGPAGHQESDILGQSQNTNQYYKNDPYSQPQPQQQQQQQQQQQNQYRHRTNNNYLPPPPALTSSSPSTSLISSQQQQQQHQQNNNQLNANNNINNNNNNNFRQYPPQTTQNQNNYPQYQQTTRTYGESSYTNIQSNRDNTQGYYDNYNPQTTRNFIQQPQNPQTITPIPVDQSVNDNNNNNNNYNNDNTRGGIGTNRNTNQNINNNNNNNNNGDNTLSDSNGNFPERPPGFTRVQAGQGARTQVHAILDYDDDEEYYDDEDDEEQGNNGNQKTAMPTVTPIQGPIFLKNGTVPVVPLFAYPTVNNGTFVQIPIWWTALSVALGLDIRGDIIRGVPCVKRYHQLFCPTAGNSYPIDKIEKFIDDNKALMRRMYGDFEMSTQYGPPTQTSSKKRKRHTDHFDFDVPGVPDFIGKPGFEPDADTKGESYFNKWRPKRQTQAFRNTNNNSNANNSNSNRNINSNSNTNRNTSNQSGRQAANANNNSENTGRVDACESKVEIVTPYWASNSAGKIRAIVNTQHFEQAIHQEVCVKVQTNRCGGDCGCEQKYKWHRLLAYDPDNDCKGIFMDWFLFPSCCVCRCNP